MFEQGLRQHPVPARHLPASSRREGTTQNAINSEPKIKKEACRLHHDRRRVSTQLPQEVEES